MSKTNNNTFYKIQSLIGTLFCLGVIIAVVWIWRVLNISSCPEDEKFIPLPPELQNANLTLDSQLMRRDTSNFQDGSFFVNLRSTQPELFAGQCTKTKLETVGFISASQPPLNFPADYIFDKGTYTIHALYVTRCNSPLICIDAGMDPIPHIVLKDSQGQTWLLGATDFYNARHKNSEGVVYYSTLTTADGKEQPFIPEDYFGPDDGLFFID